MSASCCVAARLVRQVLAAEDQAATGRRCARSPPSTPPPIPPRRRAPDIVVGDVAQRGQVLDRLVGRAVFAQADRVVGVDVDRARVHQRAHAHRVAGVVAEHQEGGVVRDEAAVQGQAVADRGHAELAHAVVDVVGVRVVAGHRLAALPQGQVGMRPGRPNRRPVPAAAARRPRSRSARPCGEAITGPSGLQLGDVGIGGGGEVGRQLAGEAALELGGGFRIALRRRRRNACSTRPRAAAPVAPARQPA